MTINNKQYWFVDTDQTFRCTETNADGFDVTSKVTATEAYRNDPELFTKLNLPAPDSNGQLTRKCRQPIAPGSVVEYKDKLTGKLTQFVKKEITYCKQPTLHPSGVCDSCNEKYYEPV